MLLRGGVSLAGVRGALFPVLSVVFSFWLGVCVLPIAFSFFVFVTFCSRVKWISRFSIFVICLFGFPTLVFGGAVR